MLPLKVPGMLLATSRTRRLGRAGSGSACEQASRSPGGKRPLILRILAAAYAGAGRFSEARDTAHEALRVADDQENSTLRDLLRKESRSTIDRPFHKEDRCYTARWLQA